jgi:uncharacterized protein DUF4386
MTSIATAATARGVSPGTPPSRQHARVAGILYLVTFAASIPALVLLRPVLNDADYVIGAGHDSRVLWGCLLDVVNAMAAVGTAVALYPMVKSQNGSLALGFVTSRMFEAAVIIVGVLSLLAVVTMRQDLGGPTASDAVAVQASASALVDVRNWSFLLGPGLLPAINATLLGTLLYRRRLVPRIIPTLGLLGAPLLVAAFLLTYFGWTEQVSPASGLLTVPVGLWELLLGGWLTFRGLSASPVLPHEATDMRTSP